MSRVVSYCHISKGCITTNDELFVEGNVDAKDLLKETYIKLGVDYPRFYKMDLLSKMAFVGTELLKKQTPDIQKFGSDEIALVFSNQHSSEDTDHKFMHSYEVENAPSPALFVYTLPSILIGEISIRNLWYGESVFFVLPQFDPTFFANYSNILLSKTSKAVIGGWVNGLGEDMEAFLFFADQQDSKELPLTAEIFETIYKLKNNGKTKRRTEKADH